MNVGSMVSHLGNFHQYRNWDVTKSSTQVILVAKNTDFHKSEYHNSTRREPQKIFLFLPSSLA